MARRSFAHTERPQGNPRTAHQTKALDALSALAKRGSANINAEQLRKPLPDKQMGGKPMMPQQKPPSPVAMEAMSRGAPQQQPPMQPPQRQQPPVQPREEVAPEVMEFTPPPIEGYYGQLLAEEVSMDPRTEQGYRDWRHDALDRFSQIRQKLDMVRSFIDSGDVGAAQDIQGSMQDGGWKDRVREMRKNMANV